MRVARGRNLIVALAFGCICGAGVVRADDIRGDATPLPTLTEGQQAIMNKLLFHTNAEPDSGPAPLTVHFSAEPFETDNPVNPKYVWDFGDDTPKVRKQNPTHTYKKPGKYKAILRVTDDTGKAGGDDFDIEVEKPEGK